MDLIKLHDHINYKRKIQKVPKDGKKWVCVAYIDARDVMNRLDEVCNMQNRQNKFYEVKGKVFCEIGIKVEHEWIWKGDSGALEENDNVDTETTSKWESSDAFKRAAVQRGIGRFLYTLPVQYIDEADYQANKYKLTEFINKNLKKQKIAPEYTNTTGKPSYTKAEIDKLEANMKNFPWTYTMTLEQLIAEKEQIFYVSDFMKESIKELYNRLPKKETPEEVGTTADEAFNK